MQDLKNHVHRRQSSPRRRPHPFKLEQVKGKKLNVIPLENKKGSSFKSFLLPVFKLYANPTDPPTRFIIHVRQWTQRLIGISAFAFVAWLIVGIGLQMMTYFQEPVKKILISGTALVSKQEVLQRIDIKPGTRLWDIDPYDITYRLYEHPIIHRAQTRRVFPRTLYIEIHENQPYAVIKTKSGYYLADRQQHLLKRVTFDPSTMQPLITGMSLTPVLGRPLKSSTLEQGLVFLQTLRQNGLSSEAIAEVDISDPLNLKLKLQPFPTIVQLGNHHYLERMKVFLDIYPKLLSRYAQLTAIDLRYPNKVAVIP